MRDTSSRKLLKEANPLTSAGSKEVSIRIKGAQELTRYHAGSIRKHWSYPTFALWSRKDFQDQQRPVERKNTSANHSASGGAGTHRPVLYFITADRLTISKGNGRFADRLRELSRVRDPILILRTQAKSSLTTQNISENSKSKIRNSQESEPQETENLLKL